MMEVIVPAKQFWGPALRTVEGGLSLYEFEMVLDDLIYCRGHHSWVEVLKVIIELQGFRLVPAVSIFTG